MDRKPIRLLLNAEPFGFGPTAAIASIMPHLRKQFDKLGYAGSHHTLDLQKALPYDQVHDIAKASPAQLNQIFSGYDMLLTASDFGMADLARQHGLKVCIYDPLLWYWPEVPQAARQADLYIAQNFFGVQERVPDVFNNMSQCRIVPPIVSSARSKPAREHVLINLGGLQNPFWPLEEAVCYARTVLACLRRVIPVGEKIVIATSRAIADALDEPGVKTYPVEQMVQLRQRSKVAFMTPGLGNIFDSAADDVPVVWLPPANDSQGQQASILRHHHMADALLDWKDINYKQPQKEVLAQITQQLRDLAKYPAQQERFVRLARRAYQHAASRKHSQTQSLLQRFGENGAKTAADAVSDYCVRQFKPEVAYA